MYFGGPTNLKLNTTKRTTKNYSTVSSNRRSKGQDRVPESRRKGKHARRQFLGETAAVVVLDNLTKSIRHHFGALLHVVDPQDDLAMIRRVFLLEVDQSVKMTLALCTHALEVCCSASEDRVSTDSDVVFDMVETQIYLLQNDLVHLV